MGWNRDLIIYNFPILGFLTQAVSVETYEIRNSRSNLGSILKYLYRVFFLITLYIYKAYFKGRCACIYQPSSSFSLKKLLRLYAKGFVTKVLTDLLCWWSEKLCSQYLLQVGGVNHVLGLVHWTERLLLQYKFNWVLE